MRTTFDNTKMVFLIQTPTQKWLCNPEEMPSILIGCVGLANECIVHQICYDDITPCSNAYLNSVFISENINFQIK